MRATPLSKPARGKNVERKPAGRNLHLQPRDPSQSIRGQISAYPFPLNLKQTGRHAFFFSIQERKLDFGSYYKIVHSTWLYDQTKRSQEKVFLPPLASAPISDLEILSQLKGKLSHKRLCSLFLRNRSQALIATTMLISPLSPGYAPASASTNPPQIREETLLQPAAQPISLRSFSRKTRKSHVHPYLKVHLL